MYSGKNSPFGCDLVHIETPHVDRFIWQDVDFLARVHRIIGFMAMHELRYLG